MRLIFKGVNAGGTCFKHDVRLCVVPVLLLMGEAFRGRYPASTRWNRMDMSIRP